ncbi:MULTISPECIES: hypothetical protein [Paenibacillus]|nr:hypothetical protein [Paenibacillus lautus]
MMNDANQNQVKRRAALLSKTDWSALPASILGRMRKLRIAAY